MMLPTTLALVAPEKGGSVPPETRLLGLPLIRRTVLAAQKAGFARIVVAGDDASGNLARALGGTVAELLPAKAAIPDGAVIMSWSRVLRTAEVRELETGRSVDQTGVAVTGPGDLSRAEKWLLRGLVKDDEGFLSRHFERPISLAISRRLAATSLTPNAMTLVSVTIGLFGAVFFLSSRPLLQAIGGLLFTLHSVLDGCDGELARLKFQESRLGGVLDFWGDNAVHVAVFLALAVGWSRSNHTTWPLWLGASTVCGNLAAAGFAYFRTMRGPKRGPLFTVVSTAETPTSRVVNALAKRDFVYIVLALSLFGKANWFLVAAAVGAPVYFFVLFALDRRHPERTST
jgi:phosphatidylglycerophosphate synthase